MAEPLTGEVQEFRDGRWRTVHLGEQVTVRDRRRFTADRPPTWPVKTTQGEGK
jgi:hypothetical protein